MHPVRMAISSSMSSASTCESHGAGVADSETSSCLLILCSRAFEHPPCHAETCSTSDEFRPGYSDLRDPLGRSDAAEGQPDVERHLHLRLRGDSRMNDRSSAKRWFFDAWSLFYDLPIAQRLTYRPVHDAVLRDL